MSNRSSTHSALRTPQSALPWPAAAAVLYGVFAAYLYQPYVGTLAGWQWLLPLNAWAAALGSFLLSRRWVAGFAGSLLAGAVYGFGPFLLGLARFHPTAGLLAAAIPWLFLPAAVSRASCPRSEGKMPSTQHKAKWLATPLLLLPFITILFFFYVLAESRLFAAPLQAQVRLSDLAGLLAPLVLAKHGDTAAGLYHIPLAALALGAVMMWKARRYNVLTVTLVGLLLALSSPFLGAGKIAWLGVSPILWLSIPLTWCAVLSGLGLQGLLEAGYADRKWVLAATIVLGALAILTLLLAAEYFQVLFGLATGYARLFVETAKMYLLGAIATSIIYLMARQQLRIHWLRWAILAAALALDILLGARHVIDCVL